MLTLIKLGGSLLGDRRRQTEIVGTIAGLWRAGERIVVVHGGGKRLTGMLSRLGIESRFANGLRITGADTMEAALMTLAGLVNKELCADFARSSVRAAGICGADCFTVKAEKVRGGDVDYGFVGEVTGADPFLVDVLLGAGCIPVIACIAMGNDFNFYNINADSMASACAVAFKADRLLFLTDVNGVLDGNGGVIPELTPAAIDALVAGGAVTGGMLPKLGACKKAVENGVGEVGIVNGAVDGIIKKVLAGKNPGTTVHR